MIHKIKYIPLMTALIVGGTACGDIQGDINDDDGDIHSDDEAVGVSSEALSYDATTDLFNDSFNASVWALNTRIKGYSLRVQPGTNFKTNIVRTSGANADFKVVFSSTLPAPATKWTDTDWANATNCTNHGTNQTATCEVAVPTGMQYALVLVRAVSNTDAAYFTLKRWWSTYCPEESCYQRHEFLLTNLSQTVKKPMLNGKLPLALSGQDVTVTLYRSNHANVMVENGVKLSTLNPTGTVYSQVACAGANEGDWLNNIAKCAALAATQDSRVNVPVKLENATSTGRKMCVVIERSGPYVTSKTGVPVGQSPCPL